MHAAQVGALDALRLDVRVADVVSDPALLAADFAVRCHFNSLRKARTFSTGRCKSQARARAADRAASCSCSAVAHRAHRPGCRAASEHRRRRPADGSAAPAATAWLAGRVLDRARRPVPDARVLAFPLAARGGDAVRDGDRPGRRASASPTSRRAPIGCWSRPPGFPTAETRAGDGAGATTLVVRVDGEGRSISGRVERGGARQSPARGSCWPPTQAGRSAKTITRAGGGFAFGGLGARPLRARARWR